MVLYYVMCWGVGCCVVAFCLALRYALCGVLRCSVWVCGLWCSGAVVLEMCCAIMLQLVLSCVVWCGALCCAVLCCVVFCLVFLVLLALPSIYPGLPVSHDYRPRFLCPFGRSLCPPRDQPGSQRRAWCNFVSR